jgi:hypothetical protein
MELLNVSMDQSGNLQFSTNIWILLVFFLIIISIIFIKYKSEARKTKLERVTVNIPFGIGSIDFIPDQIQQKAAWSLYIELVTRIAIQPLKEDEGLLSETLSSLYSLFPTTRQILRDAGPNAGVTNESVGGIAIAVINRGLRPFLARWHLRLMGWETERDSNTNPVEHEKKWPEEKIMRNEIEKLRIELNSYAEALRKIAKVR